MASGVVPGFWFYGLRVPLWIPAWVSEPLSWAVSLGPEGFSRAAELAAPLLAADIVGELVKEHHRRAYYGRLFGFGCPCASWLKDRRYAAIPLKRVRGSREVARRVARGLSRGRFVAELKMDDRGFYALRLGFEGARWPALGCSWDCEEERELGELWLGTPDGHEILLNPEYVRLNTDTMSKLLDKGWDPYSFLGLYVDVARAWGGELGAVVSNAVWWAALVSRAAFCEVERLSRVAASGQAAAEVAEEVKQAVLAAYNIVAGSPRGFQPGRRQGIPSDEELLVANTMEEYKKVVYTAKWHDMAKVDTASSALDKLVSNTVRLAITDRAIVEVLESLSEPG